MERGNGSQFDTDPTKFRGKALNFWSRATRAISDLHNPDVKSVIFDSEEAHNAPNNTEDQSPRVDNGTRVKNIVKKLSPEQIDQLREGYRFLSGDEIMGTDIKNSLLWKSVPIAAREEDPRMAGHVRLQVGSFFKASQPDNSLRTVTPSK